MSKCLITGGNGFVGQYLKNKLLQEGHIVETMDLNNPDNPVDITDRKQVFSEVARIRPERVFHLAGFSSVAMSFEKPELCRKINVDGTINLLDGITNLVDKEKTSEINDASDYLPRILIISSADVYGKPEYSPIDEKHPIGPVSPYGNSRVEQEKAALEWSQKNNLPVVICRSFAHTGPGQPENFVIPSFRKQVEEAKDGGIIKVGNLEVIRDFSDVRDVVKAYIGLIEKNVPNFIVNVGSGNAFKLKDVLHSMIKKSGKKLDVEVDPARYRPVDIMELVCDNKKLYSLIDFRFRKLF
ncbi:MAG: GDP-mannose 4,6-dehydratase [Candidatus Cloacimonetes bacterium]|nr:GDP-mannose 4,6-dehydratase [Candidatus Cloacimonadota bacterium]